MAGFIFAISSNEGIEGVKRCIKDGYYASITPNKNPEESQGSTSKQVLASVLADYCSMRAGDNVYFLSKRKIYGVGKLVNIGEDCKYNNYIDAHKLKYKEKIEIDDKPLIDLGPEYRWVCFFEPEQQFYANGIDMDEVLQYKPSAFRSLRAFQDATFIKIDDEENQALKKCIYIKNRNSKDVYNYDSKEHTRIKEIDLKKYNIDIDEVMGLEFNATTKEMNLEMLVETWMVDKINRNGFDGEQYDYVTHQLIASPFKPLSYIDRMDVFAYKFLENYPDADKPIEKYLVVELKKTRANKEMPLQLMRYVDWISKEYASGDYSLIKAVGVAQGYTRGIHKVLEEECVRSYLSSSHPNKTSSWNDIKLYEYYMDSSKHFQLKESQIFDGVNELKEALQELGFRVTTGTFSVKGVSYKPLIKLQDIKKAVFSEISKGDEMVLSEAGWKVVVINEIKSKEDLKEMILKIIQK